MKYNSIEEIQEHRMELDKRYDAGLPEYLQDYFDNKEKDLRLHNNIIDFKTRYYGYSQDERQAQFDAAEEKFWGKNDFRIFKKAKPIRTDLIEKYDESERNVERKEEDNVLSTEEIKLLITICEQDLYLFAIRYFSHYLKKPSSSFHKYLYTYLTDNINNRKKYSRGFKHAIASPRSNAKSTIVSTILPLWCLAYNKKKFIIIVSNTLGQAIDFLTDIKREIEHNELLKRDFPHIVGKGSKWKADEIITKNEVKVLALGTGSQIRGRRFGVHRPDLLIFDDLESSEMVKSLKEREYIRYTWFNKDALHVHGEKGTYTDILVIGTILGQQALLYALLDPEQYPDWTSRKFKSVLEFSDSALWDEWTKLYRNRFDLDRINTAYNFFKKHRSDMLAGTEVLWPEGDPYYDLMIEKISDLSSFLSEKQNESLDPSKILVTFDKIRFENFTHGIYREILQNKKNPIYGALDPSLGKKSTKGDYSCILIVVRDLKTGYILVTHIDLKRRSVDKQIKDIIYYHDKYRFKLFGIETNAFQVVVADNLRKYSKRHGLYIPIKELPSYTDKKLRFETHIPIIEDGTVIFDRNKFRQAASYVKGIEQITTFVGDGSDGHDDAVDALSMALSLVTKKRFKRRTLQTR